MPAGYSVLRYLDLITALRRYRVQPEIDVPQLFRQRLFNALLGNTDDHLKNFWLLRDAEGYRQTPAFDLVPDTGARREHERGFSRRAPLLRSRRRQQGAGIRNPAF